MEQDCGKPPTGFWTVHPPNDYLLLEYTLLGKQTQSSLPKEYTVNHMSHVGPLANVTLYGSHHCFIVTVATECKTLTLPPP